ncbi:hypothetical protein GUJ93_ZPchr0010g10013 [Zizania palustris]|uniref:YABBY protein C-terminal domain-containing protein n=1 Tax=Zizania palustris TaxID=103762 RepID=A0A8J6BBP2_ZIZPA|nr:hypothetical protein GUJ93_ZPchr0010g10013 [Zizania palustris]
MSSSSSSSSASSAAAAAAFQPMQQQQQKKKTQMGKNLPAAAAGALELVPPVAPSEQLCYVHCHFCDTGLVVSDQTKPHFSSDDIIEISSANPSLLLEKHGIGGLTAGAGGRNSPPPPPLLPSAPAKGTKEPFPRTNAVINRPPEKRQRVPSAYNRFIKDEIQRIKAGNPDISHREAFSAAAKNWAHFPHIHFGLMPDHQGFKKTTLLPQL